MNAREAWNRSAQAWIEFVDQGDPNRERLLDPVMLDLCGEVAGLDVADIGCGEGRFCRMLSALGARVTGVEPTEALLRAAMERGGEAYHHATAEETGLPGSSFDLAISYLTLVDIDGHEAAIREMARVLRPGGRAVVANLASYATASGETWTRGENGERIAFPLDRYPDARPVRVTWRDIAIVNWHRPLSMYMSAFLEAGLLLRRFIEPVPDAAQIAHAPSLADHLRVPLFVVMVWQRPWTRTS
jgi:SAM-dependent methyltransferase